MRRIDPWSERHFAIVASLPITHATRLRKLRLRCRPPGPRHAHRAGRAVCETSIGQVKRTASDWYVFGRQFGNHGLLLPLSFFARKIPFAIGVHAQRPHHGIPRNPLRKPARYGAPLSHSTPGTFYALPLLYLCEAAYLRAL